jgi:hypothetical protein
MDKIKPVEVNITTTEIELPKLALAPYVGKKGKIAHIKEMQGEFGYYIVIETAQVAELVKADKTKVEIKASRLFGLQADADGRLGWGKDTKLGEFLALKKVDHYKKLVGKEVMIQISEDGKFLTFV